MTPGQLALLAAGSVLAVGLERMNQNRLAKLRDQEVRYILLGAHELTTSRTKQVLNMMSLLAGFRRTDLERFKKGREWFRFLVHRNKEGKIFFYVGFPEDRTTGIKHTLKTAYPEIELHDVPHKKVPLPGAKASSGYFEYKERGPRSGLPLREYDDRDDVFPDILFAMLADEERQSEVWLDIVFSPTSSRHLKRSVQLAKEVIERRPKENQSSAAMREFGREMAQELTGRAAKGGQKPKQPPKPPSVSDLDPDEQERLKALRRRLHGRERAFDVSVSVAVETPDRPKSLLQTVANTLASHMRSYTELRFAVTSRCESAAIAPAPKKTMIWTADELANLVHLPDGRHGIYEHIPHLQKGQRSLKKGEMEKGVAIGTLKHPFQEGREVRIDREHFTKHGCLTGMTGAGKSSTALQMVQSLIDDWLEDPPAPGFSYFDPAREAAASILSRLLKAELEGKKVDWSRVHYIYLGKTDHPVGLNLLYNGSGEESDEVVTDVLDLMKAAYGGDTPQMDRLVRNALLTLVEDTEDHTALGIVPLLTDATWRKRILPRVHDPLVKQFWKSDFKAFSGEGKIGQAVSPILNRLSPFLNNRVMRRMFGQKAWNLPLKQWMDDGHIILWDLLNVKKGNLKLVLGHLDNQYYYTAKTRSTGAKEHIMLKDEAHLSQTPVLEKILFECRKFGLCLWPITQTLFQFEPWLMTALTENAGTILTCTQGPKSAKLIQEMTAGKFEKDMLQQLPERTVAVYTKTKNATGRSEIITFTIESDPPHIYGPDGKPANFRNKADVQQAINWALKKGHELQKRDGKPAAEVDIEISEYLQSQTAYKFEEEEDELYDDGLEDL